MNRALKIAGLAIVAMCLASCSLVDSFTEAFAPDAVNLSSVSLNGNKVDYYGEVEFDDGTNYGLMPGSSITIDVESPEFRQSLRDMGVSTRDARLVITYDSRYVMLADGTSYYPEYGPELVASRGLELDEYTEVVVTDDVAVSFVVIPEAPEGRFAISFEYVRNGYAATYTETLTCGFVVKGFAAGTEMAADESTRVYGATAEPVIYSDTYGIDLRGVTVGENRFRFSFESLFTTGHEYQVTLTPMNYTSAVAMVTFDQDEYEASRVVSRAGERITAYILMGDFTAAEEYAAFEDLQIRLYVNDLTDGVMYYHDFYLPIEDFSNSMCEITGITAATNGNAALGAIVGTEVWVDAQVSAFTEEDSFSRAKIQVADPSGEIVRTSTVNMNGNMTAGTIGSGWSGDTTLFQKRQFSFTPSTAGTYSVLVLGHDGEGYNVGLAYGEIQVTN